MGKSLLEVQNLRKYFPVTRGLVFMKTVGLVKAVDDVSFSIGEAETFGLIGESGCGKTTTAKLILLLEQITSGGILFRGKDIRQLSLGEYKKYRASVQAVFQDPYSSLSPRMKIGSIIKEPLEVIGDMTNGAANERVNELLQLVSLRSGSSELYPHEFSGGQRQRIAVARALAPNPSLIILDEPVSALDVSIRAQIMNLLCDLQERLGVSYLIIAHDLAVVINMSTNIGVMYLGKLVEVARGDEIGRNPLHPYTKALLLAALPPHPHARGQHMVIKGAVPSALNPPSGCRFHPRCPFKKAICSEAEPDLNQVAPDHKVACHLYGISNAVFEENIEIAEVRETVDL